MRIEQMQLSSRFPKAFQGLIYYFWIGQNEPCLHSQKAIMSFEFKGQKKKVLCVNVNEVTPQFSVLEEEKAVKMSFVFFIWKMDLCF